MSRQYKRYKGRRINIRKNIAIAFIAVGAFFLLGGVGALDCETVSLKVGLLEAFGGLGGIGLGAIIGGAF